MTNRFAPHVKELEPHDLTFLSGVPYVYHCHHYNLFHDQTVDDIVGEERGFNLRAAISASVFSRLLTNLFQESNASTTAARLEIAQSLVASMGQGRLCVDVTTPSAPSGRGTCMHYGFCWREKYGDQIRRTGPADAVGAGLVAAIGEAVTGVVPEKVPGEVECISMRAPACMFGQGKTPLKKHNLPASNELMPFMKDSAGGLFEEEISQIASTLKASLRGMSGDDRGLLSAFNVFITQHLSGYYNETAFAAIRHIERMAPKALESAEALFREAAHVCVFNTFGSILLSPEWEGMAGPLRGDREEVIRACAAIARGLGFGRWAVEELSAGKRFVLRTTSNYEAAHWLARYGVSKRSRCYFTQGAALAIVVLAHRVAWPERPALTQKYYDGLFRGRGLGFKVQTNRCMTIGDDFTEVVVDAV